MIMIVISVRSTYVSRHKTFQCEKKTVQYTYYVFLNSIRKSKGFRANKLTYVHCMRYKRYGRDKKYKTASAVVVLCANESFVCK